jgi:hypothetical protein
MLINTSRGGLVNTKEVIKGLKKGKIGSFGMDVYEEEGGLFFEDHSEDILQDDVNRAANDLSKCDHHQSPGIFNTRSAGKHCRNHGPQFRLLGKPRSFAE